MKVFLDTNVVIDFCGKRQPFFQSAATIIDMGYRRELGLIVSSLTFINVAYILRKAFPKELVNEKLKELSTICEISPIDSPIIRSAIVNGSKDFEDCVQCFSAMACNAEAIITRDKSGFADLPLPVYTPDDFVKCCNI